MTVVSVDNGRGRAQILIEVDDTQAEVARAELADIYDQPTRDGLADRITKVSRPLFSEAMDLVESCADAVAERIAAMPDERRPDEVEMQLAVKMDTKVGAKIVELSGGAQLQVTLRWKAS
ncbi:CU044_2847 family protein [Actinoallomurus sp. CA-150999]|uniref:CU044_2847 family protein n=1 Tax=Actinoallomurus sp. CA-150999 TaxID=3239887 RepID=UPI003D8D1994